jgi:Zn-dependent protease/CBS domain-containing protein
MEGLSIGRVRGIAIRVHWSVAIIGWLVAWSLATQMLPDIVEGRSDRAYWIAGVVATVGFLAALVAHELGHSMVALHHGVDVRSITLWVLGGVARLDRSPETPSAAIRIAAAGPAVSIACGVIGLAAGLLTSGLEGAVLVWFGSINLLLAVFNLLPAFPLDGGRIYQAWLWSRGLPEEEATAKAARLGGGIGRAMVWLGVIEILLTGLLGGLWLMAIGWFLREASHAEAEGVRRESTLRRYPCSDVMTPDPECVPATESLDRFVDDVLASGRHAAYPVVDYANDVVGLIELKSVRSTPRDIWPVTPVSVVMTPLAEVPVVAPEVTVDVLVRRMGERADTRALVMDGARLVGIIAPSDVVRLTIALELTEEPVV